MPAWHRQVAGGLRAQVSLASCVGDWLDGAVALRISNAGAFKHTHLAIKNEPANASFDYCRKEMDAGATPLAGWTDFLIAIVPASSTDITARQKPGRHTGLTKTALASRRAER
jgi:hypothetical protein